MKVLAETLDERPGDDLVVETVDRPHDFFRVPRGGDLSLRITGREQPEQFLASLVDESFVGRLVRTR